MTSEAEKKASLPEWMAGVVVLGMIYLGLLSMINTRTFGIFPSGACAYEVIEGGKGSCPDKMPDKYNSHPAPPNWGQ